MITLLYKGRSIGPICRMIARASEGVQAVQERDYIPNEAHNILMRWDSIMPLPEGDLTQEINRAEEIRLSKNKRRSRMILGGLCPTTWFKRDEIKLPCIMRPRHHFGGHRFLVCNTARDARRARTSCGSGWYASEIVDKEREYRVYILQDYVISMARRVPADPHAIAWNVSLGNRMVPMKRRSWPAPVMVMALEAARRLCCNWAVVDIAVAKDGTIKVFDVNTAPGMVEGCMTMKRLVKVLGYIIANKEVPPRKEEGEKRIDLIHPALIRRA